MIDMVAVARRGLLRLAQALAVAGIVVLTGIALGVVVDVALRWAFAAPIDGLSEVVSLLGAITIASFIPLSLYQKGHPTIGLLAHILGPSVKRVLDALSGLITFAFFAAIAWQFARYAEELAAAGEQTWILQLSVAPWWTVVAVLMTIAAITQLGVLALSVLGGSHPVSDEF